MQRPSDCVPVSEALAHDTQDRADRRGSGPAGGAFRRLTGWLGNVAVAGALLAALAILLPAILGMQRYVITGGSMTGTYNRGSIVFAKPIPVSELQPGDVITYDPPPKARVEGLVTHRIYSLRRWHGRRVFRTKGDANPKPDPWQFTLAQPTQPHVVASIPHLGFVFAALGERSVRMVLIGLPALLIAAGMVVRLWREAGRASERVKPAPPAGAPPG